MSSWKDFFRRHAAHYMKNQFTRNTLTEVGFLLEELSLPYGSMILDMGCGTGRHSIALAERGFRVTGVDISTEMLAEARKSAELAKVKVDWVETDATEFKVSSLFDAAICLCEGAFGLLNDGDDPVGHDLQILHNISAALRPAALFVMTTLNGFRQIREIKQEDVETGMFNLDTMVETMTEVNAPEGMRKVNLKQKYYVPSELKLLLHETGFEVLHIWGGTAGEWGRRKIRLDEMEFMIVARKTASSMK
jgi:2-polyprenyl-3-methyl-5-hydroxy-6-metoxy-1,4-benzoquinol methylase